jgi:HlyD family secretion protein
MRGFVSPRVHFDGRRFSSEFRIALPPTEVARLNDIRLVPGMPVEAFIQTHERTPLEYLLKPLREQIARTFRER